jgi:RNA polymerase sigma factor (sigma-70 family)
VPGKTLATIEELPAPEPAIRAAFADIERQIEAYKANARGEHWWKRLERRKALRELKANAPAGDDDAAAFHSAVDPHVATLSHFARHLVRRAESNGDLLPGELDAEDLVSDVLLRAYEEWGKERPAPPVRGWLMRLALRQLQHEIERSRGERRGTLSVEKSAPETPPSEEVTRLGEEILDFYQPDEALRIEDVLPDIRTPSPEEELETAELRRCVREALNQLPKDQRRALILRYVLGFGERDLSKSMRKPQAEVDGMIEDARTRLRETLTKRGCAFDPQRSEKSPATARSLVEKQLK